MEFYTNKKYKNNLVIFAFLFFIYYLLLALTSCSFDYGQAETDENPLPNLVMENVEYVRVISAEPLARFHADRAERYEKQGLMKLDNVSFEQFGSNAEEINVQGKIGYAAVDIDTGNINMEDGVKIEVTSEEITIETEHLHWHDEQRILSTGPHDSVYIYMNNGSNFTGTGFTADARRHAWDFKGKVQGDYIFEDKEEDE